MPGVGTDIMEIDRIAERLEDKKFMNRVFTAREQAYIMQGNRAAAQRAAGIFCAKEAVAKAFGTGFQQGLQLTDIEVSHTALGAPTVQVAGKAESAISLSISHCRTYAVATAVLWEG